MFSMFCFSLTIAEGSTNLFKFCCKISNNNVENYFTRQSFNNN